MSHFDLTNTELGDIFAVYGIFAMVAYFPGGMLADRFNPKKLMVTSLLATALGGVFLASGPNKTQLYSLFGYWGVTTILLFWAAMIKITRAIGGESNQGSAFGILDGFRGLTASVIATLAVLFLATSISAEVVNINIEKSGLNRVIWFYTCCTAFAAILIGLFLPYDQVGSGHSSKHYAEHPKSSISNNKNNQPLDKQTSIQNSTPHSAFKLVPEVLSNINIWLQGGIVICAYCGYKALDNYGLYTHQILGYSELESAQFTAYASYLRFFGAISAGLLADRWLSGKTVLLAFSIAAIVSTLLALTTPNEAFVYFIIGNLLVSFFAIFALRGVYFTLIQQSSLPLSTTGTAVGLISFVGYTPDIFFASIAGRILDANPGIEGFQNYFLFLTTISLLGIIFTFWLNHRTLLSVKQRQREAVNG